MHIPTIPDLIERPIYLSRVLPFVGKELIKVFVGQRRVGKSYLLYQVMDHLSRAEERVQQIYINRELHEYRDIQTASDLIAYVTSRRDPALPCALFIDEIQDITNFEDALRHFQTSGGFDIYCTGSNARMLSGELATYLSGRYIEIKVYGLSFLEFAQFHGLPEGDPSSLDLYLRYGGLPYLRNLTLNDTVAQEYLRNILDAILLKDVVSRFQIRNVDFLKRLAEFLADNVGSLVSAKRITEYLKSQRVTMSHNLVLDYLSHMRDALLVFRAQRYEIQGRKIFEVGEKYYFEDLGLRHALVGYRGADIGKIMENTVYMHLRIAGYQVHVGRLGPKEIDFVGQRGDERIYVQVAYLLPDDATREREFGNLLAIKDNHPKVVVTMDQATGGTYKGIPHLHLRDFLTNTMR